MPVSFAASAPRPRRRLAWRNDIARDATRAGGMFGLREDPRPLMSKAKSYEIC